MAHFRQFALAANTHPFQLSARLVLLVELLFQHIAVGLQLNDSVLVLAAQLLQFPLELVLFLLEKLLAFWFVAKSGPKSFVVFLVLFQREKTKKEEAKMRKMVGVR